jgi:hypothetical protein
MSGGRLAQSYRRQRPATVVSGASAFKACTLDRKAFELQGATG